MTLAKKIAASAVIASHNEAQLLDSCLASLSFCEEIVVYDLESQDSTADIAKKHGTRLVSHAIVPAVEMVHKEASRLIKNDWMLITDPDEVISVELSNQLLKLFPSIEDDVGMVFVPIQYYFKGRPLSGGIWGGLKKRRLLVHIKKVNFIPNVHDGVRLKPGFLRKDIEYSENNVVHHFWMSSYGQLISKHRRYIKGEGKTRYDRGERFARRLLILTPVKSFREYLISYHGFRDGARGIFLALFWAWYNWSCLLSLKRYQQLKET